MTTINARNTTPDEILDALNRASAGETVLISDEGHRVFKITEVEKLSEKRIKKKRRFGFRRGALKYMAPDFNEPLDDFKGYTPE